MRLTWREAINKIIHQKVTVFKNTETLARVVMELNSRKISYKIDNTGEFTKLIVRL
jgi:hypothetical protein